MPIQQNLLPNEPTLADLLDFFKKEILLGMNCHHLGTVQVFDSTKQTARVTINYKKTFFKPNTMGVVSPVNQDYPIIIDAPVIFPGGGGGGLTFPVEKGDQCLVLFNDRDIDLWFNGNNSIPVNSGRLHSFSDALILIGPRSLKNLIIGFNSDAVEIRKSTTSKVSVYSDKIVATVGPTSLEIDESGKIKITNSSGEFISSLIEMIKTAYTITMLGNQPLVLDPSLLAIVESFEQ